MKKYQIILADPPWLYDKGFSSKSRKIENKYNTMTKEDLRDLPVPKLADDNCILFMWVTFPKFDVCFDIIKAWGFEYKTVAFVWIKTTKNNKLHWGMGHWTRNNAEVCLLATKGVPKRKRKDIHEVILAPVKEHSAKPPIVMTKIVELMGDLPRVELFSRTVVEGWDRWGNETISNVDFI